MFIIIIFAQAEFYAAARKAGHHPATALCLVGGAVLLIAVFSRGEAAAALVLFLTLVACFGWYLSSRSHEKALTNIAVSMLGVLYIPLLGSFAGLLISRPDGAGVTIVALGSAAIYDVYAYAAGSRWGKTPLAPSISPKKTREGAAVATVGIIVTAVVVAPLLGPWSHVQALLVGVFASIFSPLGDLAESMLKRDLGIKDSGTIIPGHGGALDRIDAILFTAPAVYLSLRIFGL